jgi:hypothetical protein
MKPRTFSFEEVLAQPESDWIDWKADFPPGRLAGKRDKQWDEGRGKLPSGDVRHHDVGSEVQLGLR